jgi:pimeloyl-ACP methyl ester carboxylesterase
MKLQSSATARALSLLLSALLVTGCSVMEIKEQAGVADNLATVRGSVEMLAKQQGVINVVLYRRTDTGLEVVRQSILGSSGKYEFTAVPGIYVVGAFVDTNNDGVYQRDESAGYVGAPDPSAAAIEMQPGADVTNQALIVSGPIVVAADIDTQGGLSKAQRNTGRIASLAEPVFSFESAKMGLWRPVDFVNQHGGGLMMLQAFEPGKVPVVFVHGISGSALSFDKVIQALDKNLFQPWVLQYPSGVRLEVVSEYLRQSLDKLYAQYKFPRIMIVAHSMGGLMTRSFMMKYVEGQSPYKIAVGVTINSPLQGIDSAIMGVKTSPIVVPVWRDIASNSEYVQKVNAWQWPKTIPYHLIFSYLPDEVGDGVVPLTSQLSLSLQDQATVVHGFQGEHTAVLADPEFGKRLLAILASYREVD